MEKEEAPLSGSSLFAQAFEGSRLISRMKSFFPVLATLLVFGVSTGLSCRAQSPDSAPTGESAEKTASPTNPLPSSPAKADPGLTTNAAPASPAPETASHVATLAVSDLRDDETLAPEVKNLIAAALDLTTLNLPYKYGSSDPRNGGMDCSGTVYYLLNAAGVKDVPRDSSEMYQWVWQQSRFQAVVSSNPETFELEPLKPGDLLFWTGTYQIDRDPPITHVMIYLGINRHTGRRVMVGASEGRTFNGKSRYGVSVFDFVLPQPRHSTAGEPSTEVQARFVGYGPVPGLENTGKAEK
jgi:cell wall-associated NlpC family hydrolase